ncbi:MAG: helix-turn-helix domain-containing protein, partial [Parvibaculaceae bacterium]
MASKVAKSVRHNGKRPVLGERLHELRKRHTWTLKDVSDRTGVSVATLSKVER